MEGPRPMTRPAPGTLPAPPHLLGGMSSPRGGGGGGGGGAGPSPYSAPGRGLHSYHFSAQPEPFLTQNAP